MHRCVLCARNGSKTLFFIYYPPIDIHSHRTIDTQLSKHERTEKRRDTSTSECIVRKIADRYHTSWIHSISFDPILTCAPHLVGRCQFLLSDYCCCLSSIINPNAIIWLRSLCHGLTFHSKSRHSIRCFFVFDLCILLIFGKLFYFHLLLACLLAGIVFFSFSFSTAMCFAWFYDLLIHFVSAPSVYVEVS